MKRLLPTRRLLAAAVLWLLLGLYASWQDAAQPWWLAAGGLLLALLVLEAILLLTLKPPQAVRELAPALPLAVWETASLSLRNPGRRRLRLSLTEHLPAAMESEGLPVRLTLAAGAGTALHYRLRSLARGDLRIGATDLLLHGALGLLDLRRQLPLDTPVRVFPNFAEVAKFALLATDNRLSQLGIRVRPRRGEGMEFHQLRDFREGDSLRQVDWKATSRLRRLISREYQDERDQQVMLVLDTGFRMRAHDNTLSHFDQALNAALLLSHVVTRQGDALGLMTFAGYERFLQPRKGPAVVKQVMNAVFDLQPTLHTPDYLRTVETLAARLNKRSLVIFMTNLRDEDSADLLEACRLLGRRHLVLLAVLREQVFDEQYRAPAAGLDEAFTLVAAEDYLHRREKALRQLGHAGAVVLDTVPAQLPVRLVNRYLDIKRSGRL